VSWVTQLARPEIVALQAYEHAVWEPELERLHANELPWRACADESAAGLNRYPEPQPRALVERLASLYEVAPESVLVGRGSDEAIDLLIRGFCRAGQDSIVICPPTFGMYSVAARIQGAEVVTVPLAPEANFALDARAVLEKCSPDVKVVFLCSPNNPTGPLLSEDSILSLTRALEGRAVVVVDEAYVEFSGTRSLARHISDLPHLAVLRTLSKAYALAGARCGTLIADPEVVALLSKVIPPYAIAQLSLEAVLKVLEPAQLAIAKQRLATIVSERERLLAAYKDVPKITRVWPSAANFILAEFEDAALALSRARGARLLIRDVRGYPGLSRCLRISVGSPEQNDRLLAALR
jgi:histidinol-phosphate aminotransferase